MMSFSFHVRAAAAALALAGVTAKMAEVVASQPVHAADEQQVIATAEAYLGLVPAKDGHDYSVNVNGSVISVDDVLTSASGGVSVGLVPAIKEEAAA